VVTDLSGDWESWSFQLSPNVVFRSGDEISLDVTPQGERLDEPFEVSEGSHDRAAGVRLGSNPGRGGDRIQARDRRLR
jgi:hypothetical protein